MATLVKQSGNYYLQFYDKNRSSKRKRIALRTGKKKIALKLQVRLEDLYALGKYDPWYESAPL